MFLPTLAECFSASYPEALVMKKPIITTDLGFARSTCGDAALYYELENAFDAGKQILKLIQSKSMQDDLILAGVQQLRKFDDAYGRAKKIPEFGK